MQRAIVGVIFCISLIIVWRTTKQFYYVPHLFSASKKEPLNDMKTESVIDSSENVDLDNSIICALGCGPDAAYKGGVAAWQRFLKRTLIYPKQAVDKNITGRVIVQFCID